jgi:hypothetical protein
MFCAEVRIAARHELRKQGKSFKEAWEISQQLTDEVIGAAVPDAKAISGVDLGQFGDGTILKILVDWIESPQGQQFFEALLQILLKAFGGTPSCVTCGGMPAAAGAPPPWCNLAA